MNLLDARRRAPRISVDSLVGVAGPDDVGHATMSDLSVLGLRLERVFDPAKARKVVQLEIELPGIDEVLWTSAHVTRAWLTPIPGRRAANGQPVFWCRAGLRLGDAASREKRLLRDYVIEEIRSRRARSFHARSMMTALPSPPAPETATAA